MADADALRRLAKTFNLASGVTYRRWVETSSTTAALKVQIYDPEETRVVDLGDGDVYDVAPYDINLCRTAGNGLTLNLATGAVLRASHLQATQVDDESVRVFFDGGTFQPVFSEGNSYLRYVAEWIVGAGGVVFDLSTCCDDPANATDYLNIKGVFRHDLELGDNLDGGLVVKQGPLVLGGDFVCAFTGPVRAQDGARLTAVRKDGQCVAANCRIEVAPSATLEQFNDNTIRVSDLALGTAEASEPTHLALFGTSTVPSFAVTNALQVLSPVWVSVRKTDFPSITRTNPTGVSTVLVFNASNATIDPTQFSLNPGDHPAYEATFACVAYEDPALPACDTALVMTCTKKAIASPTWTAVTGGGDWNSLQNWMGTDLPPNAEFARAVFNPATAADVPVSLPADGVTLRALELNGADGKGYSLEGGVLAMAAYRAATPVLMATSGTHRVAALQVADKLEIRTATNTPSAISSLAVAALTGAGDVSANTSVSLGAGTVKLDTTGFTGTLTTGSGSTEVSDLSFASSADRLKTGASTFRYTGTTDAEFGGFQLNGGRATCFETDANLLARAPIATKGALIKAGTGTLTLGGTGSFAPTAGSSNNENDRLMHANGDTPAGNYYGITVNEGTLAIGVVGDPSQAPFVKPTNSRAIALGTPQTPAKARRACLQLNNGTLSGDNITMSFYLTSSPVTDPITLRYEQNGGAASVNYLRTGYNQGKKKARYEIEMNGGVLDLASYVSLNYSAPSTAQVVTNVFTVNGGVVNVGTYFEGNTAATKAAPSFVTLNGGRLSVANRFDFTKNTASKTVLDLNAGAVFEAGRVMQTAAAGGTFNFNGGTFVPLGAANGTELKGLTAVNVSTNGAVIDTSKVADGIFTINQALNHDARLGADLDGGLVKKGAGTLVLAATNAFTGSTLVEAGTLKLTADGAIPAAVAVAYDGVLDLNSAARAVPALVRAPGVICNGTLTLTRGFEVSGDWEDEARCPFIDADLAVTNTAAIDLGLAETAEGPSSATVIPLACVTGAATVPATVKAVRAGKVKRFALKMQSGMLLATPMSGGTLVVFR